MGLIRAFCKNGYTISKQNIKLTVFSLIIMSQLFLNIIYSQEQKKDNVVGSNYTIHSKILKEDREIQIYLPESYESTAKKYPVLYILDGQQWFLHGVGIAKLFSGAERNFQSMPEFIVVGITTDYKKRYNTFNADAKKTLNFIEEDVISFLDKKFRTTNERMIFGWQFAGAFLAEILIENHNLFDAYFISTPYPITDKRLKSLSDLFSRNKNLKKTLYLVGSRGKGEESLVKDLIDLLKKEAPKTFRWKYKRIDEYKAYGHRVAPYTALANSLRDYFYDYLQISFRSIEEYYKLGGFDYIKEYYRKRAAKYGFSSEITDDVLGGMVYFSIREDNYPAFEFFTKKLKANKILELRNKLGSGLGDFYLKYNKLDEAIISYKFVTNKYPKQGRAFNGLGDTYLAKGDTDQAITYYKKAVELGKKNSDLKLAEYEADLAKILK